MREQFEEQLALLDQELIKMGALCEEAIGLAASALAKGSSELAAKIAPIDRKIDAQERNIETICLRLLLKQQPVARDLRQVSAALKMVTDMERIGDQAEDIAEIITFLGGYAPQEHLKICEMARAAMEMVTDSVDAYVNQNVALAKKVVSSDDIVDDYFCQVKKALIGLIAANQADGEAALDLLMIAKYFERIGDHATNIAEWVLFSILGHHVDGAAE